MKSHSTSDSGTQEGSAVSKNNLSILQIASLLVAIAGIGVTVYTGSFAGNTENSLAAVNATNLVGEWQFEEATSTSSRDLSGRGNTATLVQATWAPGARYTGVAFDGINDRVEIANSASLNPTGSMTASVWVKLKASEVMATSSQNARFLQKGLSSTSYQYAIVNKIHTNGTFPEFRIRVGGKFYIVTATHSLVPERWYNIVGIRSSTKLSLYINGVLENTLPLKTSTKTTVNTEKLYLGESPGNADGALLGTLDDVRIYSRALTSSEVSELYAEGKPFDLQGLAPYPRSSVITDVTWAPTSSVATAAEGGDNWPLTWADDDALYGAYGDANGFDPKLPTKLGLGFVKITGSGDAFSGTNIRSPSGEQLGNGQTSKKASGLLMVDGTLYMLARNVFPGGKGCQVAFSNDHAVTWNWSSVTFSEFVYCTFLNYGKNYSGARDSYVYIYSHDNPSAYDPADQFILMRVPKQSLLDKNAYEFYAGTDASSTPLWTPDISLRKGVFRTPGRAERSSVTYDAGIGRYLWWQMYPDSVLDERFEGGFGVYDAPEPWGPWTTVYFTTKWDMGPGETGSFPTKWMSPDGKTLYLVSSSNDAFSVRKVTFTTPTSTPSSTSPY